MTDPSFSPDNLPTDPVDNLGRTDGKQRANAKKNAVLSKKGLDTDPSPSDLNIFGGDYFLNYELSWLKFNWRVLAEAENKANPLLERIKFIGIVCSNLDEFFQKRVED